MLFSHEPISAANHLAKVEKHAVALETAADHMDAAGLGGHPTKGHAITLRRMAGDLRAKAAKGELPSTFDAFNAAADTGALAAAAPVSFAAAMSAAADEGRRSELKLLHARAERILGRTIAASAVLDLHEVNTALDEQEKRGLITKADRWRIKDQLYIAGCLPA